MPIVRRACWASALSLLAALAAAGPTEVLRDRDINGLRRLISDEPKLARDPALKRSVDVAIAPGAGWSPEARLLAERLEAREAILGMRPVASRSAAKEARAILGDPAFREAETRRNRTGLSRGGDVIGKWIQAFFEWLANLFRPPVVRGVPGIAGTGIQVVVWVLLGLGLAAALFLVARSVSWGRRRRSPVAMQDADEPARTADEWLARSLQLEDEGRYREAVRCLYLAILVRMDGADIVRFVSQETNWEHLRRFEASERRPVAFGLREPTQAFDNVWYGTESAEVGHVSSMRDSYRLLMVAIGQGGRG